MNLFEKQYKEIINFLYFEDYTIASKRIIDLTISFYKRRNYRIGG